MDDTTPPAAAMAPHELIDVGVNLTHESFAHDLHEVLERAAQAGVTQMVVTGSSAAESAAALALAREHPNRLFATAGVHPHLAREWNAATASAIRELCVQSQVVAVGEAGLDFNRDFSPRSDQERAFHGQLEIAAQAGKPVFMHERDAFDRFIAIVREHRRELGAAVVHCFTGDERECDAYLDLDLHLGITGWICDERRGHHLREVVRRIPTQRLMLETDAPYLLPRDLRPRPKCRRNEPMHLAHILAVVAECTGVCAPSLAAATTRTARSFFALPQVHAVMR
jgi:TatD DNase family protein